MKPDHKSLSSGGVTSSDSDFTLALQPDAGVMKLVAAESVSPTANNLDFAASRYSTDGQLDTTFGNVSGSTHTGKITVDFGGRDDIAYASVIQPGDNKIVLAGSASFPIFSEFTPKSSPRYSASPSAGADHRASSSGE